MITKVMYYRWQRKKATGIASASSQFPQRSGNSRTSCQIEHSQSLELHKPRFTRKPNSGFDNKIL